MHIIVGILLFILGACGAAAKGDYSGILAIGKTLMIIGGFFFIACILTGFTVEGSEQVFLFSFVLFAIGGLMAAMSSQNV